MARPRKPLSPCKECSNSFEAKYFREFCTPKCAERYHTRNKMARKRAATKRRQSVPRVCHNPLCSNIFTGSPAKRYCSQQCSWSVANGQPELRAREAIPRQCANPDCSHTFTGNLQKLYCSASCKRNVLHKRPTIEYERALRAKRTATNIKNSGHCSICGNTLARSGYVRPKPNLMLPPEYSLCSKHARGYAAFISWNNLDGHDPDEVFAAYLVRKTFATSSRAPFIVMIRKAFHTGSTG
jgi:hypothetical protein